MIVVDTDVLLWWANGSAELSSRAKRLISKHAKAHGGLLISPMTLYEIAELVAGGYISLTIQLEDWLETLSSTPAIHVAAITPSIAMDAASLELNGDVDDKDRLIAALARDRACPLVTANQTLIASEAVETVW